MKRCYYLARSLDDTERLGAVLARLLPDNTTIALHGTLGAGKTRLVQSIAANSGVPRNLIVSPTFVLCQEYHGQRSIYHFDAYRLKGDDEFQQLGPQEYFDSPGLVFIEWAERVESSLPDQRIEITIEVIDEEQRSFEIVAIGDRFDECIAAIQAAFESPSSGAP